MVDDGGEARRKRTAELWGKRLLFALVLLLATAAAPLGAHVMNTGISRWCFGKSYVVVDIELDSYLIGLLKGIREGGYNPDSLDQNQLPKIAREIIQPYMDDHLRLTIDNKPCRLRVIEVTKSEANLYRIRLYGDNIGSDHLQHAVKIDYQLLFEETAYAHQNVASMFTSDGPPDTVQSIFDSAFPKWQAVFGPGAAEWEVSVQ